ncbi:MAG: hypothetical protein KC501_31315 [Myxococcales bacterium]|nr:hypothetical protein [Myxococcales bacterium]
MPDLVLENIDPVVLSTHVDSRRQLQVSFGQALVDTVVVKVASRATEGPLSVRVVLADPVGGGRVAARHSDDAEQPVHWERIELPPGCAFTWNETGREYEVTVSCDAADGSAAKDKTVYIRVKPVEDLPDRP